MEQVLHRGRRLVGAGEHDGVVASGDVGGLVLVVAARARERAERGAAVGAVHPRVGGAERELGELGLRPHRADRGEQRIDVHTVPAGGLGHRHGRVLLIRVIGHR